MKTMLTMDQLVRELDRQKPPNKKDWLVRPDAIRFITKANGSSVSELDVVGTEIEGLPLGEIAHDQLADRLNIPKRFYDRLRHDVPDLLDVNVNRLLRERNEGNEKRLMIRRLDDQCRAVLTDRYARIDNYEVASIVIKPLADLGRDHGGVEIRSCAVTDKYLYIKATLPRVQGFVVGDIVTAGVFIRNSEVGYGKFVVAPFLEKCKCTNGMVAMVRGEGMMERIHLGHQLEADEFGNIYSEETRRAADHAFILKAQDTVRAAVDEARFHDLVASLSRAAESEKLRDVSAAVQVLSQREDLTDEEGRQILTHLAEGGDLSRWGLANSITRTAEDARTYDRATELEVLGGKVALTYAPRDWQALVGASPHGTTSS